MWHGLELTNSDAAFLFSNRDLQFANCELGSGAVSDTVCETCPEGKYSDIDDLAPTARLVDTAGLQELPPARPVRPERPATYLGQVRNRRGCKLYRDSLRLSLTQALHHKYLFTSFVAASCSNCEPGSTLQRQELLRAPLALPEGTAILQETPPARSARLESSATK